MANQDKMGQESAGYRLDRTEMPGWRSGVTREGLLREEESDQQQSKSWAFLVAQW